MVEEAVDARLAPSSELLAEIDILSQIIDRVVVGTLNGGFSSKHVRKSSCVSNFLLCHELKQVSIFSIKAQSLELRDIELSKAPVEEVEFDPLLVQS